MKQVNPMAEDSFEKARGVFFGTVATVPKVSAPPTDCLKPEARQPQNNRYTRFARRLLSTFVESRKPRVDPPHQFDLVVDSQ